MKTRWIGILLSLATPLFAAPPLEHKTPKNKKKIVPPLTMDHNVGPQAKPKPLESIAPFKARPRLAPSGMYDSLNEDSDAQLPKEPEGPPDFYEEEFGIRPLYTEHAKATTLSKKVFAHFFDRRTGALVGKKLDTLEMLSQKQKPGEKIEVSSLLKSKDGEDWHVVTNRLIEALDGDAARAAVAGMVARIVSKEKVEALRTQAIAENEKLPPDPENALTAQYLTLLIQATSDRLKQK